MLLQCQLVGLADKVAPFSDEKASVRACMHAAPSVRITGTCAMRRSVRRCSVIPGNYDSALHCGDQRILLLLVSFHLLLVSPLYSPPGTCQGPVTSFRVVPASLYLCHSTHERDEWITSGEDGLGL